MKTLILVDLQNDFLPGGALAVPDGDAVIPVVNRLQPHFDYVVATQDWHPPDHGSFASSHPGREPFETGQLAGRPQTLWPEHCVQHTDGARFAPGLDTQRIAQVFTKGHDPSVDSYSGFHDNEREFSTGLADWLRQHSVNSVWIAGLATDYCVKATALDALHEGFQTHLIVDACRGIDQPPGHVAATLAELEAAGVKLVHSQDLLP
ncbi:MAG: bifunctional nicotinamidase/pyrazinamidase [Verrucomicrobia bacterium]|nr:bifunctional nicotinamidase/pyrazinamidase [Verrucomicrobiota bacterium]